MAALIGVSLKPKDDAGGGGYTCDVPLSLLAEDGVPPAEGDTVSYSVDGTVQGVDGDSATIKIDAVNGQPVGDVAEGSEALPPPAAAPPPGGPPGMPPSTGDMRSALAAGAKGRPMPF